MKWKYSFFILALVLMNLDSLWAHFVEMEAIQEVEGNQKYLEWFGRLHPIVLHFPIVLIFMAGVSELLSVWDQNPMYLFTTSFLLLAAALFVIPTVLSGWAFEESHEIMGFTFWWHKFFGILTLFLTIATVFLRVYIGRQTLYFVSLSLTVASVLIAAHFGGLMVFGPLL